MKSLIIKYKFELAGISLGALAGWSYWYFIGCSSGTCTITSNPINSAIYGSVMGALLLSFISDFKKNK